MYQAVVAAKNAVILPALTSGIAWTGPAGSIRLRRQG